MSLQQNGGILGFLSQRASKGLEAPPVWRRLFHIVAGSSIPLAGIFASETGMIIALAIVAGGGLALDMVRFRLTWLNRHFLRWMAPLLKRDEEQRFTGATYMAVAALFTFLLFGSEVAIPAMFFLSLGDPAAALVGRRLPGPRLGNKSPGGTLAFILVGFAVVGVLIATDAADYHWGLWIGAVAAGLVELLSPPPDDNLVLPLAAGAVMYLAGV